jgi:hypothetical protein
MYGFDNVQFVAPKQQLTPQGRPIELPGGELPAGSGLQSGRQM